jgi:AcrR family transcriptional regulator
MPDMARTVDERRRAELLERITDYVAANGLSELQLRPLAKAVGSSPRVLLYYFTSKEELVVEVLKVAGQRQRELFATLPRSDESYGDTLRAAWRVMSAPQNEALFRLYFECYGLALQDRTRFPGLLERAISVWLDFLTPSLLCNGYTKTDARAIASVMLAGVRGFLLDLCTTGDRKRLNRAVELWILALDAIPPQEELPHGKPSRTR